MTQALKDLGEHIAAALPGDVTAVEIAHGELMLRARRTSILRVVTFQRDDQKCLFKLLAELCGVDYPDRPERFEVVYNLLSLKHNQRVRVKVSTDEEAPVPSATGIFSTAGWL